MSTCGRTSRGMLIQKERKLIEKNNKLNATSKHLEHNGVVNYVGQTGASGAIELDGD